VSAFLSLDVVRLAHEGVTASVWESPKQFRQQSPRRCCDATGKCKERNFAQGLGERSKVAMAKPMGCPCRALQAATIQSFYSKDDKHIIVEGALNCAILNVPLLPHLFLK